MGAKVVPPFPPFFQIPRILRKGAIDPAFKNENIKKRKKYMYGFCCQIIHNFFNIIF